MLFPARPAVAKNLPGLVQLLAALRRLSPSHEDVQLALVGGTHEEAVDEAAIVEAQVSEAMAAADLDARDVVRIPSQPAPVIAALLRGALAYVGLQKFEPFGIGVAEAMAVGAPVVVSKRAGIVAWLEGECAVVVDPDAPEAAAQALAELLGDGPRLARMLTSAHDAVQRAFTWPRSAELLEAMLDEVVASWPHRGSDRSERAFHRLTPAFRGDLPAIQPRHRQAASRLLPRLIAARSRCPDDERLIVAIGGESGSGKSEVATVLSLLLRAEGLKSVSIPGDAYFRRQPAKNHRQRLSAHSNGTLEAYLGSPEEIDYARLDALLQAARSRATSTVQCPSDSRAEGGRRYERVPLSLEGVDVVIIEFTWAMALETPALRLFLEGGHADDPEAVERRNFNETENYICINA